MKSSKPKATFIDRMFWPVTLIGCTGLIGLVIIAAPAIRATYDVTPLITPQPVVSRTSVPTQVPQNVPVYSQRTSQTQESDDPIIACEVGPECGGGVKNIRRSMCETSGCCQIGNQWVFYTSQAQCVQDQRSVVKDQQAVKEKQASEQQKLQEDTAQAKKLITDICLNNAYRKAQECDKGCGGDSTCMNSCTSTMDAEQKQCLSSSN